MSDTADLAAATEAWLVAKKALSASDTELAAAKAGNDVAKRCEREAWEKIALICGRDPNPPPPPQAPSHRVYEGPFPAPTTMAAITSGRMIEQHPLISSYRTPMLTASGWYCDSRARP